MDYQLGRDLLSELPLSIIHVILALVPIRDVVKTSILSRQWRYTWTSLPWLKFEEHAPTRPKSRKEFEDCVESFITHVLFHHKGPIHKFELSLSFQARCPNNDKWILCLAWKNIKELILDMALHEYHKPPQVHSSIYSCEKLTNLKLNNCKLNPPPSTFKGFLFLRCLCLRDVCMPSDEIECLVTKCPLLEKFGLFGESQMSKLRITSPNLKYLDIYGNYIELCVSAPLLAEMSICLAADYFKAKQKFSVCNYIGFMDGLTNLKKLSGCGMFIQYLSMGIESCHCTLVFHQLKEIKLYDLEFDEIKAVSVVAHLIVGAPNLEKLEIRVDSLGKRYDELEAPHPSIREFGCASNCTFKKLRVVKFSFFYCHPLQTEFLKFLLQSSPVLETMSVSTVTDLNEEKIQKATVELLGFGWASPNAKLWFFPSLEFA